MNDGSQNQSDSGNENVDTEFTGGINQNKGLQSDSELANQDQNRENAGEISDSEEAELLQMKIGSPVQPARAQRPRMEIDPSNSGEMRVETQLASAQRPRMGRNPSDTREMRAHNPHVTRRENRDDPNHRTTFNTLDGSIGQVDEPIQLQCGLAGDAQRPPDDLEGQEAFELGAHRPQTADAMPRRSSRPVKKPEYLSGYVTEIDDFCD